MGSSSSKIRKHLSNGDEYAALNQYNNSSELRKVLDPNSSYGDSHNHETALHYASKFAMKSLLRIFLSEHNGNPNKTNGHKHTCLHCVCMEKAEHSQVYPVMRRRAECLAMLLKWRGATLADNEIEKINMGAQDEEMNTALHYAALSGLKQCVEMLVQHGAPLFLENKENQTPCDSAEKGGHADIALYLESKMVFSADGPEEDEEDMFILPDSEEYNGLRAQDLQEAKDQLLVETADMLSVPLFTAEALLRNHEWSREILLEAWMTDAKACCERSGVTPPPSVFSDRPHVQQSLSSLEPSLLSRHEVECEICTQTFITDEDPVQMACLHQFCKECWRQYLDLKIQEGEAHNITCPAFDCIKLVTVEVIESVVCRDMARRYLQFDIKAFVESNPNIRWCPFPGCCQAVKMPETQAKLPSDTSKAVDCGKGHLFCWECLGEAHEPASCENWTKWYNKIGEVKPEEINSTEVETENAANCLWLVTNSKSCPNCKSPIQKNEGCNHMKCSKCKYDFCWVCLDQWKRHNSSTGGYFKCNRYEAVKVVTEKVHKAQNEAEEHNTKMQELNKFVHYYTRFKNHENSFKLEEPLLSTTKNKMMKLAEAVTDIITANAETRFVEDAVHQLLKARRVLKCSYVYGYYLDGPGYKKIVFEFMQTELEECTEILSQMVNRLYLRTPRKRIIEQAQIVQRKRQEFLTAIAKGLVPPETPPGLRKQRRRKYSMDFEDDELRSAVLASIQDIDPANPWIKDASGRHTNVTAMLDWPDSDDSDSEVTTILKLHGTCLRNGCSRTRVKNPRTGDWHEYCSRACMQADQIQASEEQDESQQEVVVDEQMDLLRALEMSRLLYLQEQGILFEQQSRESVIVGEGQTPEEPDGISENTILKKSEDQRSRDLGDIVQGVPNRSVGDIVQGVPNRSVGDIVQGVPNRSVGDIVQGVPNRSVGDIVQGVPNRSVGDVGHGDCIDCLTVQKLLADTGIGDLDLGPEYSSETETKRIPGLGEGADCISGPSSNENGTETCSTLISDITEAEGLDERPDNDHGPEQEPRLSDLTIIDFDGALNDNNITSKGGAFGIIKDLSPSNIDFGGDDKTKNFSVKPKLMNTMSSNPSELLRKKSNQCWSDYNSGKRKKQKQVKLSPYASDITFDQSQASFGLVEHDLPVSGYMKSKEDEEDTFDLQLSLKKFMTDLKLQGCEEFDSKCSEGAENISWETITDKTSLLQYPDLRENVENKQNSVDLDMSVKSGYDSCMEYSNDDIEPQTDNEISPDLSDLIEAETVVSNFLNAQMLKNYPLESPYDQVTESSHDQVTESPHDHVTESPHDHVTESATADQETEDNYLPSATTSQQSTYDASFVTPNSESDHESHFVEHSEIAIENHDTPSLKQEGESKVQDSSSSDQVDCDDKSSSDQVDCDDKSSSDQVDCDDKSSSDQVDCDDKSTFV